VTVTDVAEQPPVITSNGGGATAALSVPENQGAGREGVRPNWPSVAAPADLRRHRNRDDLGGEFTHIGRVQRPGIAEIDAESGAVSGWDSIPGRFTVSQR